MSLWCRERAAYLISRIGVFDVGEELKESCDTPTHTLEGSFSVASVVSMISLLLSVCDVLASVVSAVSVILSVAL